MSIRKTKTPGYLAVASLLGLYALYMYWQNSLVPYMNDDILYRYIVMYQQDEPVSSISDIFTSQYLHYRNINGRSVIHFLLQLLLLISPGKLFFNICNSIVWILLVCLVVKTAVPTGSDRPIVWIWVIIGVRFLLPDASSLCFWASGSLNYIWTAVICLAYLLLYSRVQKAERIPYAAYPLLFILSVLVGWTHEALVTGVCIALLVYLATGKERRKPLPLLMFAGLAIGLIMMLIAPGNYVKMSVLPVGLHQRILKAVFVIFSLRLFWLLALLVLIGGCKDKTQTKAYLRRRACWFLALFVNLAVCCVLGVAGRAIYFVELTALILLTDYLSQPLFFAKIAHEKAWVAGMLVALCGYEFLIARESDKIYGEVNRIVQHIYSSGEDYTVFRELEPSRYVSPFVLSVMDFCRRYNIPATADYKDKIRFIPSATYRAIHSGRLFDPENRLPESQQPFYTTPDIPSLVMPSDTQPPGSKYILQFYPPSLEDPNLSPLGRLRRIYSPATLPSEEYACDLSNATIRPYTVAGQNYIILPKPRYQRIRSVRIEPDSTEAEQG